MSFEPAVNTNLKAQMFNCPSPKERHMTSLAERFQFADMTSCYSLFESNLLHSLVEEMSLIQIFLFAQPLFQTFLERN